MNVDATAMWLRMTAQDLSILRFDLLNSDTAMAVDQNQEAAQFLLLALADLESAVCHMKLAALKVSAQ